MKTTIFNDYHKMVPNNTNQKCVNLFTYEHLKSLVKIWPFKIFKYVCTVIESEIILVLTLQLKI